MNKGNNNYRTIILKLNKTEQLETLARESGRVYSKTISYIRKIHNKKNIWLNSNQIQKIIHSNKLYSGTTQSIIQKYFVSLNSYFGNHKSNPDAKPPHKTHKYYCIPFKQESIKITGNCIYLSCSRGNPPIIIPIPNSKNLSQVQYAEINWDDGYRLNLTIKQEYPPLKTEGKIIGVDSGEIHPLAVWDGETGTIYNGRLLRSLKQHREKVKASYTSKIDLKKTGSINRHWLFLKKKRRLAKINRRIKDVEHKITRHFAETCDRDNVSVVVFGDTTNIRQSVNYGKFSNQKIHQWAFDRIRNQVQYKLAEYGMNFILQDERDTSHTCPACGKRVNPNGRNFRCPFCGFQAHRDIVGGINILSKYQGQAPVVASMAHATGVRFNYHLRCLTPSHIPS